ncbi:MAG TPA: 4'-phosphopantetheinyl transferase superfamily protein [Beijerinckiaceae bacterium]|nr:4'-phosphopantetheinyl transferase superfamily protein [Beijerinckiaceae bacterium]
MAPARFGLGGRTGARRAPIWLTVAELAAKASPLPQPIALLADLDDPACADLANLAPSEEDLIDAGRPSAGARAYFLRRRALLRLLVGYYLSVPRSEVKISYDAHGAPLVASNPSCFVSVSARGSLAALAVACAPIGVDIELSGETREPVWTVLHEREREFLKGLDPDQRHAAFLRIWTMKEAYLKAIGRGFERDPTEIEVSDDGNNRALVRDARTLVSARAAEWKVCGERIAACFVGQ